MQNKDPKIENDQNEKGKSGQRRGDESNKGGTATQRAPEGESTASNAYKNETGDPGRTPGTAEGVENFEKTGNE